MPVGNPIMFQSNSVAQSNGTQLNHTWLKGMGFVFTFQNQEQPIMLHLNTSPKLIRTSIKVQIMQISRR